MATKKAAPKKAAKKAPAKKAPAKKAVKKSVKKVSNLDRLVAADVIPAISASEHNPKVINKLSATEVNTLIKLRKKLGSVPAGGGGGSRPNFPV
ncbi:MAG TPA: hypothetical protein VGB69_09660 [Edaphobacter sp.]